jgi:hypothetical protein
MFLKHSLVGIKGAMEQKSIDRHPVGANFSSAKLAYNNWQTNARPSFKTGKYRYLVLLEFPIISSSCLVCGFI